MVVLTSGGALHCIIAFCYIQMSLHSQSQSYFLFVLKSPLWLTLWRCILDAIKCLLQAREYNQLNCSGIWIELHFCSIYRHLIALCHSSSVINILLFTPSILTTLHFMQIDAFRIFFQVSNWLARKNLKIDQYNSSSSSFLGLSPSFVQLETHATLVPIYRPHNFRCLALCEPGRIYCSIGSEKGSEYRFLTFRGRTFQNHLEFCLHCSGSFCVNKRMLFSYPSAFRSPKDIQPSSVEDDGWIMNKCRKL